MNWENTINERKVIKITPNLERANSLIKSSSKTLKFAEKNKIDEENAGILLSNYYESLIEILHALVYKEGFKVLDHISFTYYIEEKLKRKDFSMLFDKYRKIRNSLIYYGKSIEIEISKQGIKDIKELIKFIENQLKQI